MNRIFGKLLALCAVIILSTGCYEDLGSYQYEDINDISVTLPELVRVTLPPAGAVQCELKPEIKRTQSDNEDNLSFVWRKEVDTGKGREWREFSNERDYKFWVTAEETQQVKLRFEATDTITGVSDCQDVMIWKVQPFSAMWFVLQDVDNKSVLGSVDVSADNAVVDTDIRKTIMGDAADAPTEQLQGSPRFIMGYPNYGTGAGLYGSVVEVFTDEGGYMLDGTRLNVKYNYSQLLFAQQNAGLILKPEYAKADYGEVIINDGTFWHANSDGYSVFYPVKLDETAGETYKATHAVASFRRGGAVVYDALNKRFLYYDNRTLDGNISLAMRIRGGSYELYNINDTKLPKLKLINELNGYPNKFNPNSVEVDEMLYMGTNQDELGNTKAISIGRSGGSLKIYEISFDGYHDKGSSFCPGYSEFAPEGTPDSWSFAASANFERIFFYASGNKIFRVDMNRTIPKQYVVYSHPDERVVFSKLKFKSERVCSMNFVEGEYVSNNQFSDLGVAVKYPNGEYGLLELKLNNSGVIAKKENGEKAVAEHTGFKKIVDIAYTFKFSS